MPRRPLTSPTGRAATLAAVHPNAGLTALYRRKLDALIDAMHKSLVRWLLAQYRATPPLMAADDDYGTFGPARSLTDEMAELGARWASRFDEAAPELARWFATAAKERADGALAATLRNAGMTVRFTLTPEARDVMQATIGQNVALIKSIAAEHLAEVEGAVMRSVAAGRDVGTLAKELEARFGVTRRRAAFIARSQNGMATATITRVRQTELGVTTALWLHSGGGRHPRPSHRAMTGKPYEVSRGWFDPDERQWIWPGVLPNCRCVARSVVSGLD
jgi:SPP1 gp7 family putative phage head morphogenesis protein